MVEISVYYRDSFLYKYQREVSLRTILNAYSDLGWTTTFHRGNSFGAFDHWTAEHPGGHSYAVLTEVSTASL